jgi:hypothetical protein
MLRDRDAAACLDDREAARAVVEPPGEDEADDARAVRVGGGPKERIDGGTEAVRARPVRDADAAVPQQEMLVGGAM